MKKDEKKKVGRPKLADPKLKKESIYVSIYVLIITIISCIFVFKILTINYNPKYMVGTIYNDHVNSCVIKDGIIDCGPNVTYMKYKLDKSNYKEIIKENISISKKVGNYKTIEYCFKTSDSNIKCNN